MDELFVGYRKLTKKYKPMFNFYLKTLKLSDQIAKDLMRIFYKESLLSGKKREGVEALFDFYEMRIQHYFRAHYELIKSGILLPSYNNLRTIYETFLRIYIMRCYDDIAETTFKYETRESFQYTEEELRKIESDFMRLKFLSHKFVIPKLYKQTESDELKNFYHTISMFAHPGIRSTAMCWEVVEASFVDSLKLGIGITYPNFIIIFELYSDKIKNRYKNALKELISEYPIYIPEGSPNFLPTLEHCIAKLSLKTNEDFINSFE